MKNDKVMLSKEIKLEKNVEGGVAQMVERPLSMRKVRGSMPLSSNFFIFFVFVCKRKKRGLVFIVLIILFIMEDREMDGLNEERIIAIPDSFSLLNSSFLLGIDLISNYNCIDEAIQSVIMMIGNEICFNNNDLQVIILSSKRETNFLFFSYFLNLMKEEKKIRYHISRSQQAMGKEEVAFKSRIHFSSLFFIF